MMKVTIDNETFALIGVIIEKTDTTATVDFNHLHAGKDVVLSLEVLKLFKACK
jgi:FKBP-type peptidyl-prolyl cis-trans isomerase 2